MSEEKRKVTIEYKASNKKGFKIAGEPDQWYTASTKEAIDDLAKVNKGDNVEVTYTISKDGVFRNVSKIIKVVEETKSKFACEDCGAELKDGKYKKCYNCNKKAKENPKAEKETKPETKTQVYDKPKKEWKSNYNNPEKNAQIQRGNALAAAGNGIKGNFDGTNSNPQVIAEAIIYVANLLLDWLHAE